MSILDDFHKANAKKVTSYDLNAKCVCIKSKNKKKMKQLCNKKARRETNMIIIDEFAFKD